MYEKIPIEKNWIFNKLALSQKLGYITGPAGLAVPKNGWYCVRPIMNLNGMGVGSSKIFLKKGQTIDEPGYFWTQWFDGIHLSIDYFQGQAESVYQGYKEENSTWKFNKWVRKPISPPLTIPNFLVPYIQYTHWMNIEFIDGNIIEIHLRPTEPVEKAWDEIIVQWSDNPLHLDHQGYHFIASDDYTQPTRLGFWVKNFE